MCRIGHCNKNSQQLPKVNIVIPKFDEKNGRNTPINKALHRKKNSDQHKIHQKLQLFSRAPEGKEDPALDENPPCCPCLKNTSIYLKNYPQPECIPFKYNNKFVINQLIYLNI